MSGPDPDLDDLLADWDEPSTAPATRAGEPVVDVDETPVDDGHEHAAPEGPARPATEAIPQWEPPAGSTGRDERLSLFPSLRPRLLRLPVRHAIAAIAVVAL